MLLKTLALMVGGRGGTLALHHFTPSPRHLQLEAPSPVYLHLTFHFSPYTSFSQDLFSCFARVGSIPLHCTWQAVCVFRLAAVKHSRTTSRLLVCTVSGIADSLGRGCVKPSRALQLAQFPALTTCFLHFWWFCRFWVQTGAVGSSLLAEGRIKVLNAWRCQREII